MNTATLIPANPLDGDLLREDEHEWVVRTERGSSAALTRVARRAVTPEQAEALRHAVTTGAPLDERLPWELRRILEGYRVRASLPAAWPLPPVVDAGVTDQGLPFVSRGWIEGTALSRGWAGLVPELRDEVLVQVLDLLSQLHGATVVVQDLKPDNVVIDADCRLWLVDLESLRLAPAGALPCTHYTPRFAAPEQLRGRVSTPASDLYAFGRMAAELEGGVPAAKWAPVVGACLAEDPRLRPTAAAAARGGQGLFTSDATIRVPEPEALSAEASTPPTLEQALPVPAPSAPPTRTRWRAGFAAASAALVVALALGTAGAARWTADRRAQTVAAGERAADALVAEVRVGLRDHKVVAAKNNDQELARIAVLARQAAVLRPSADSLGLEALATVWSQRWHWKGARWDPEAFAVADRLSQGALDRGRTAEGVLARGLVAAAGCRHAPRGPAVEAWCDEAVATLDEAAGLGPDWLAVEARWGAVMVLDTRAKRALDRGDRDGAVAYASEALRTCELARPALPAAKVNGAELVEDCAWAAGAARDPTAWLGWSGWLLEHRTDGTHVPPALLAEISRSAAPECARLDTDAQGLPVVPGVLAVLTGDATPNPWANWCGGMAGRALRCAGMSLDPSDPVRRARPEWCPR
ncbi:MAG: hypothetical protein ABMA64_21825 [Myxococcota bacterium]